LVAAQSSARFEDDHTVLLRAIPLGSRFQQTKHREPVRAHGVKTYDRERLGGPRSETVVAAVTASQDSSPTSGHTDPLISATDRRDHRSAVEEGAANSGHTGTDDTIIGVAEKWEDVLCCNQHDGFLTFGVPLLLDCKHPTFLKVVVRIA
jgi:hypothetical protein